MTVNELVTETKLAGSSAVLRGLTTPEGWPFVVVVAVASPGNEWAVVLAEQYDAKMQEAALWSQRENRMVCPLHPNQLCVAAVRHNGVCAFACALDNGRAPVVLGPNPQTGRAEQMPAEPGSPTARNRGGRRT